MYHKSKTGWEEMILCSTFLLKVDRDNQNRVTRKTIKGSLHKNDVLLRADHFTQIYCWCLITFESFNSGFTFSPYVILLKWAAWAKSWQTICHLLNNSRFAPLPLLCEGWGDERDPGSPSNPSREHKRMSGGTFSLMEAVSLVHADKFI